MSRYAEEWKSEGLQIYAIGPDSQEVADQAKSENNITIDLISDSSGNAAESAGIADESGAQEGFALVDKTGKIIYKSLTFDLTGEIPKGLQKLGITK